MCSIYNNHYRNKKRKIINEENNYVPPDCYPPEVECNNNAAESNHTQKRKMRKLFNVNSKNCFGDDNIVRCHEMSTEASTASGSYNVMSSHLYKKNEHHSDHSPLGSFSEKEHKKHKKDREKNSTNDLGNENASQILNSHNNPCLHESLSDITIMNKHKDKGNNLVSTLDNLTDKDVDGVTVIYEDQYSDRALLAGSLRKKYKKKKSNYTSVIKDSNIDQILNCYELPYNTEVSSDGSHKKHKKYKESKANNLTGSCGYENIDQVSNSHNILCLNGPVSDSHFKKKHKKYKENSLVTTSDILLNKTVNKTSDVYEEKCLGVPFSADTLRKKHKKHKIISNCVNAVEDTDIAQVPNYVYNMEEPLSNAPHNKKHKRHKKSKDKNLANGVENDYPISNSHNILYPNEYVSDDQAKKRDKKYKENSLITTFLVDNLKNKTVNEIVDINEEQFLDASLSTSTPKERHNNYKNVSSCSKTIKDTNIAQIPNCYEYELPNCDEAISDASHKKKHRKKSHKEKHKKNKDSNLTNDSQNVDVDPLSNCHNILCLDEPVSDGHVNKKHRKYKENSLVTKSTDIYKDQYFDAPLSAATLKEKHKKPQSKEAAHVFHKKKHKEHKDSNLTNGIGNGGDQIYINHNILCLNEPVFDGQMKKKSIKGKDGQLKEKKGKEKSFVATDNFDEKIYEVIDIYDEQHMDASVSDGASKKKHKKRNITEINSSNSTTAERDTYSQIPNYNKKPCMSESIFDAPPKKIHKKDKKGKDSSVINTINAFEDVNQISNNINYDKCSNLHDLRIKMKKKSKKGKERNFVITTDALEENTAYQIQDVYEIPYVDDFRSDCMLKKKHKKSKNSDALEDNNMDQFLNCNEYLDEQISCNPSEKKFKKHKNADVYSSIEKDNEFNRIFITDFDAEITDKSHKNSLEVTQRVSKINERLRQRDPLVLDFTEDFVDFEIPPLHANESLQNLSKEKKNELLSQGVIIKTGKFTHDEDVIIMKNCEDFLKTYDILDTSELLGIGRQQTDNKILKFLKAKHFYVRLGKGLNDRSLSSIYKRARRLLHPNRSENSFEKTEVKSLKYLRKVVNRKWSYIADALEKTEDNCIQAYRWHGKGISLGEWTEEEEQQLIEAIKNVTGSSDLSCGALQRISWDKVANQVPTRTFSQCRMHWAYHLAQKPGDLKQKWERNCSRELVYILRKDWYVENVSQIDWLKVYESFVDVAPSHIYVQRKWLYLKSKIAGFKTMSYKGIINALCKIYNITPQETHSAPFSSFAKNQSISHSLEHMKEFTEDARI